MTLEYMLFRTRKQWIHFSFLAFTTADLDASKCFRDHVIDNSHGWINIGYVRKSPGKEDDEAREQLLQLMFKGLQSKFLCRKIYARPNCSSDVPIMERDKDRQENILSKLHSCNGDMQGIVFATFTLFQKQKHFFY